MTTFTTTDGTNLFYKDWGQGQPIVFSHGWPLSGDAWDAQMQFFGSKGFRVIAHDRRGHGRSDQTWDGNSMDRYAADLGELIAHLNLKDAVLVGHSTGGGEIAHYVGTHGSARVARMALVSAVPPLMLKTEANPHGTPLAVFDTIRNSVLENRSQFYLDLTLPFFGFNREGAAVSEGTRQEFWREGMQGGIKAHYDCIREFSEVDYSEDLRKIDVPVLVVHGDDDQIVPIDAAGRRSVELLRDATLKVYQGAPHGLPITLHERLNEDLLAFIKG
ncbi:MAG: alpha/beta hydrolase [Microvirga sp.]